MKIYRQALPLTSIFWLLSQSRAQNVCPVKQLVSCRDVTSVGYHQVFERLSAPNSSSPNISELSATPAGQFPVHIFREGLELAPGSDYELTGRKLVLQVHGTVSPSVDLEASYSVADEITQTATIKRSQGRSLRSTAVLTDYLQRSLNAELDLIVPEKEGVSTSQTEARSTETRSLRRVRGNPDLTPAPYDDEPASMRMLRTLQTQRSFEVRHRSRRASQNSADSPEGLGDVGIASPFDLLSRSEPTSGRSMKAAPPQSREVRRRALESDQPASERMLRDVLLSRQQQDKK